MATVLTIFLMCLGLMAVCGYLMRVAVHWAVRVMNRILDAVFGSN
jgi:hypothetical protein